MKVELGNHSLKNAIDSNPGISYLNIPDTDTFDPDIDITAFKKAVSDGLLYNKGIVNYGNAEALLTLTHPFNGAWSNHSTTGTPKWVWSDNADFQRVAAAYYGVPEGRPSVYDDVYWRYSGARLLSPGVPGSIPDVQMLLTNVGRVVWAHTLGGGQTGTNGTATATTSTTLTSGAITSVTANQYQDYRLFTGTAWANIVSHTSGTTPVFTFDQWYSYSAPGGAAASTPSSTTTYGIADGGQTSFWFIGIATGANAPAATDTSLSTNGNTESTTNGMVRKIGTFTLTSGTSPATYTQSTTWTYTSASSNTYTTVGFCNSIVVSDVTNAMGFETSLSTSATLAAINDTLTVTDTVTGS